MRPEIRPRPETRLLQPRSAAARIEAALRSELGARRGAEAAERFRQALPIVIHAPRQETAWRAALVGPGTRPAGYRDAVVLSRGRLYRVSVRQRHRRGANIHQTPAQEVGRALAQARGGIIYPGRAAQPLIPRIEIDEEWLRDAARGRDIPLSARLASRLLPLLREAADETKSGFRNALDPRVAELLTDDRLLELFHDWLSDESVPEAVRAHRRNAFAVMGTACTHILANEGALARLDAGAEPVSVLAQLLEAERTAVATLLEIDRSAFADFETAQRKAWALDLNVLPHVGGGTSPQEWRPGVLDRGSGWAGRLISFAGARHQNPVERRKLAEQMLSRGIRPLRRYSKGFRSWNVADGRERFGAMTTAIVRLGVLPPILREERLRRMPRLPEIDRLVADVRDFLLATATVVEIDTAVRRWSRRAQWLEQTARALSHPSAVEWRPLFEPFDSRHLAIECAVGAAELDAASAPFRTRPTLLYDVLADGLHVLRFRSKEHRYVVGYAILTLQQLEAAIERGRVDAEDLRVEHWKAAGQWRRWLRVEVGHLIQAIATGKIPIDTRRLRRDLAARRRVMDALAAMPCGFDHRSEAAAELAARTMAPVLTAFDDETRHGLVEQVRQALRPLVVNSSRRRPGASPQPLN